MQQQQRQPRLGDILDDYCPRERRITNHAVVAMIDSTIKQTRCTTCDAEHEYREAKVPSTRRRKDQTPALYREVLASVAPDADPETKEEEPAETLSASDADTDEPAPEPSGNGSEPAAAPEDGPVHRPLIRATLPRIEGQTPERRLPEFTFRQNGRNGKFRPFDARGGQQRRPHGGAGGGARFASGGGRPGGGNRAGQRPPLGGGGQQRRGGPGGPGRAGKKRSR
jgi:hypothetical protein